MASVAGAKRLIDNKSKKDFTKISKSLLLKLSITQRFSIPLGRSSYGETTVYVNDFCKNFI